MGLGIKIPKNTFTAGRDKFAKGDDFNNVELEPGKYICQVVKGRGVDTEKGPKIILELVVAGEVAQAGGKISIWFNLAEEYVVFLFRTLSLLGYQVQDMDEKMLEDILSDIETTKPVVRVKASRRDDMVNYRIEKLLTDVTIGATENAADTDAMGGKAGISEEVVETVAEPAKPSKPAVAAPAPKAAVKAPVKAPDPAPTITDEVVSDDDVVEEEQKELGIGDEVTATLKSGVHVLVVTAIDLAEQKITGRSKTDQRLYKCGLDKLS